MSEDFSQDDFVAYVRNAGQAVISTIDAVRGPEAALVSLVVKDNGDICFHSDPHTRKVANLEADPRIALLIGWSDRTCLQVEGVADILTGAERKEFVALFEAKSGHPVADELKLIRTKPSWVRHCDARTMPAKMTEFDFDRR
ncbi:pyridoxamine 5'-phosphate oxidase family protein [Propionibacterium sp.]|uniref:pyridoxamine 5'-phosphate oxidase family protein n=1 Tax=Propionibacterium sp. TaxID=1977903 RepID=UPI0039EA3E6E